MVGVERKSRRWKCFCVEALDVKDKEAIHMSNYVAKLLDANRLSKDTLKAKEVATMSKRRSAAHDALIGFPPGPKEFRLLAEINTPGGS